MKQISTYLATALLATLPFVVNAAQPVPTPSSANAAKLDDKRPSGTFEVGKGTFLLNGKPFTIKAAELHYPRIPRDYWEHRIRMCKALGMNTICLYVFWNIHEQREGEFDFTGNNDVAAFCRLARKHGMYVIVRPGPYVCAEWEMGGLPWWLLRKKDIALRDNDPYFMERVAAFEQQVARQLAPLTIDKGGPVIMVQVENEYGAYNENKPYVAAIRDMLRGLWGKDVVLFQCDWASTFERNGLDDLVWTMNFGTGSNIDDQFRRLREVRPDTPLMCSEFWSGWFDKWGMGHETRPADAMVSGIDEMLSKGISFSLYMTHGGTSFGHWAGANSPALAPDVTSYDYDAPIGEYGQVTPKYHLLRECLRKYSDRKLPKVPDLPMPLISLPKMELTEYAPIVCGIDSVAHTEGIRTFEEMDMGWGSMLYSTVIPVNMPASRMEVGVADYARVFVDGKFVGTINRVKGENSLAMPALSAGARLQLLVEGMGRINFGWGIKDFKGLTTPLTLTAQAEGATLTLQPSDWTCATLPDSYENALRAFGKSGTPVPDDAALRTNAGYYRGYFRVNKVGDTFLNMENWGKGLVYINGHALGRFWNIGPQQTLYVPGCWLHRGRNEVVVLDVVGPTEPTLWCEDKPVLDKLCLPQTAPETRAEKPRTDTLHIVAQGNLPESTEYQTIRFDHPVRGRYLFFNMVSTHDGAPATIAEIFLQTKDGKRLDRTAWTVRYVQSEQQNGNHTADKAFDMQESTFWQAVGEVATETILVIDLGSVQTVEALEYLPKTGNYSSGAVDEYEVCIM